MFFYTLIFLCVTLLIYLFKIRNCDYWKKRNIRQADETVWSFLYKNCSLAEVYKNMYDKYSSEQYIGFFLGSRPGLLLRNLEDIQAVLAGDFQSFYSRGIPVSTKDVLAHNVLFIDDFGRWKVIRQKLTPVFTTMKLKNMFYILEKCARDFVEMIEKNPKKVNDDPFSALYTYTTASIGASVFGIDTQKQNTMDSPFKDMAKKSTEPSLIGNMQFFMQNNFTDLYKWINMPFFHEHETFFVGAVRSVLESRRNQTEKRHDFIDICLELQKQGTMKDSVTGVEVEPTVELLAAQAFFFFLAGSDTSCTTLQFTLLELSSNPDILQKVHEEIDQVFESCDEKFSYNEIEKLKYLEMVLNESMRKYPTIGLMQRQCIKDATLPGSGVKVPKGSIVVVPTYGLHRDKKYFPYPELFDPERFSPENIMKLYKYSYLPFGEGNRICLGNRFARLQALAGLAWMLRRFTLRAQSYKRNTFEPSVFSLRDSTSRYEFIPRHI